MIIHKKLIFNLLILLFLSFSATSQFRKINLLTGVVSDSVGHKLENASITIMPGNFVLFTNPKGEFRQELVEGFYSVSVQYLNATKYNKTVRLNKDIELEIVLGNKDIELDQLVVKTKSLIDVQSVGMGKTTVDIQTLKKLPSFLGEVDVIKSISALPGVVNAGEGASGFYVRGGGADQNLVLLDGAPIFNSSHLFGFFSVFNPDILKSYTLHRNGISAKYGGRISSILDVESREGDPEKIHLSAGISFVSLKLGIDGNLGKKTTFVLAGRLANPNYLLKLFPDKNIKNSKAFFYDANFKINHKINSKNSLVLSSYASYDDFKFPFDTTYSYSNKIASVKWNHSFSNTFSSNVSYVYSNYLNEVKGIAPEVQFNLSSQINNQQLKADFLKETKKNHIFEFGTGIGKFNINPGDFKVTSETSSYNPVTLSRDIGNEIWGYVNDELIFSPKISLAAGLRYTLFQKMGSGDVFIYDEQNRSQASVIGIKDYSENQIEKSYGGFEPRLSLKYAINKNQSFKVGLSRIRQNIQLISNTSALTPADVWRLSNTNIKPLIGDQISLGYYHVPKSNQFEFSWEVYFKQTANLVDYKDGAELLLNKYLEADLLDGKGIAYGSEWFLKKNKGELTGWLSFSYSRSLKKIKGNSPESTINNGSWYPSNYDKPININLYSNYQFPYSPWSFSANFTFVSGRPVTAADSWFVYYGDLIYSNYYGRNQERMPSFHRLDVAFLRQSPPENKRKTEWGISVYNLYFRKNAFSTLFKHIYGSPPQAYKLAIIGIAIPSLVYNIKI